MGITSWLLLVSALGSPQTVSPIRVEGNRNVSAQAILFHLQPLRDQPLTRRLIERTFRRLWDTGLFEDIQFRQEDTKTGERLLIVEVEEKPWLRDVQLEGEKVFRTPSQLRQALSGTGVDLRPRRPFGEEDSGRAARTLEEILGRDYDVTARRVAVGTGRVDLIFTVDKRSPIRIDGISLVGNQAIEDSRLRKAMRLTSSGWVSRLTGRDRYEPELLEEDLKRIRDLYLAQGFFAAEVGPAEIAEKQDGRVHLTIPIREGPVYRTGSIEIDSGFLLEEKTVSSWLSLSGDEPHDGLAARRVLDRIENRYRDAGYASVEVERQERVDAAGHRVDLAIRVHPGRPHSFGRIDFNGNHWVRDQLLRQYLAARERDRFSSGAIEADARTLPALGLVESVTPETRLSLEPNVVDLIYHLKERPRFEYFLGGSSNGVQGTSGSLALTARDVVGRLETWDLEGDLGNRLGNVAISLQDAHSLGHRLGWGSSFVRRRIDYPDETTDDSAGFSIRLFGPVGRRWQVQSNFQWARFELKSDLTDPVPFLTPFLGRRFQTHRVDLLWGYEGRNQPIFPSRGSEAAVGAEVAGGALGGDVSLIKLRSRAQQLIPLGSSHRHLISLRGRLDAVWPFGTTNQEGLPRFERLFLGSEDDMRGFPIREVGPQTGEGVPIGGDRLVYASLEYQFAMFRRARVVGFFDLGNVYARDLIEPEILRLRYDAGGEFRLQAPLLNLPLRLGYGFNLDRLAGEPQGRLFFTLSARF